ncbi:MAG: hypothetical protein K2F83_04325 [Oscillospiraceae bacterium]|nr:hypothetical protein [Oscillospiraceae bacterium]
MAGDEAGEVYHYYRMEVDQAICELIQYYQWLGEEDSWNLWEGGWRTELWYTPKDGEPQKYLVENVINSGLVEEEKLVFADVDYDGTEEILVGRGHFGNRGYLFYACYFQREGTLQFCESFSEIRNPCLDREKKAILSCWTQSGAGYVWSFYEYQEQSFVETRRLTVIFRPLDDGFELCTVEILQNDQMETIHQWQGNECSYERLEELFFNEGNDWALHTDRWEYI